MIEAALLAAVVVHSRGRAAVAGSLTQERGALHDERDRTHAIRAERTRWLEEHGASASFAAGVVRPVPPRPDEPLAAVTLPREVPVIAAMLDDTVAFLVDPPERWISSAPIEVGSIPRDELRAGVVRDDGAPVRRPAGESFDAEPDAILELSWPTGRQRLVFRSSWLAWRAADRFLGRAAT